MRRCRGAGLNGGGTSLSGEWRACLGSEGCVWGAKDEERGTSKLGSNFLSRPTRLYRDQPSSHSRTAPRNVNTHKASGTAQPSNRICHGDARKEPGSHGQQDPTWEPAAGRPSALTGSLSLAEAGYVFTCGILRTGHEYQLFGSAVFVEPQRSCACLGELISGRPPARRACGLVPSNPSQLG